jgi:hypothetical protein
VRDRIEFVGVALGALQGHSEHGLPKAIHAIKHFHHSKLLGDNRSFLIDHAIAEKTSSNNLILGRVGQ